MLLGNVEMDELFSILSAANNQTNKQKIDIKTSNIKEDVWLNDEWIMDPR